VTDLGTEMQQQYNAPQGYRIYMSAKFIEMVQHCASDKLDGMR